MGAARGLDINDVEWVVNFDFPLDIENYIHRIGRTGRASKKGQSLTYMTVDEARFAKKLKKILIESGQEVPEDLIELEKEEKRSKVVKGKLGKELEKGNFRARNYGCKGTETTRTSAGETTAIMVYTKITTLKWKIMTDMVSLLNPYKFVENVYHCNYQIFFSLILIVLHIILFLLVFTINIIICIC